MRIRVIAWMVLAVALPCVSMAHVPTVVPGARGDCSASNSREIFLVNQTDANDCDATPSGTSTAHCCCLNGSWGSCSAGTGGGSGTVTSAAMTVPTGFTISGSPITTSGTFALGLSNQSANTVWSGPTSGGAAAPAFRSLVDNDVPDSITVTLAATATALAANGSNCAAGKSARGVDAAGAAESCDDTAPYGLNDPLMPPASAGTGGCIETFAGGAEVCTWAWANQDSASIAYDQGGALLLGDATNELHIRAIAAATNADQTFTVRLNTYWDGTSADNDMCGIVVTEGGTLASPTSIRYTLQGDLATNGFYWVSDTDYAPTGSTTLQNISWDLTILRSVYVCHQLRYIDSTRAIGMYYSTGPECTDWAQLGSNSTLASDPLYWGFHVRQGGPCRIQRVQLRTDTNRNVWGTP